MTDIPTTAPSVERERYFVFVRGYPFERSEHEVRLTIEPGFEGELYTVVKPDEVVGYTIHVGTRDGMPKEWELERLHDLIRRTPSPALREAAKAGAEMLHGMARMHSSIKYGRDEEGDKFHAQAALLDAFAEGNTVHVRLPGGEVPDHTITGLPKIGPLP